DGADRAHAPPALPAVGRPAAAGRDRARAGRAAAAAAGRRADRQPGHDRVAPGAGPAGEDQRRTADDDRHGDARSGAGGARAAQAARAGRPAHRPEGSGRARGRVVSDFFYNLRLVVKSLRRDRWFTLVMVLSQALSVSIFVTALTTAQRYSNMTGQLRSDVFRVEGDRNSVLTRFYRGTQFEGLGEFSATLVSLPTARAL